MSHFTVLVVGDDVEKQLAPFQENNMGDCPGEYMEFNEVEAEYRNDYENESIEMVQAPNGERFYSWDQQFKVGGFFDQKTVIPDGYEKVMVAHKDRFASFEEFMSEWHGSEERDPEMGVYGYWANPQAKWDWFQVGGRWTGFFKMKPETEGGVGKPGILASPAEKGYADQAYKKDIDFAGMRDEAGEKAGKTYDKMLAVIGDHLEDFIPLGKMRDEVCGGNIDLAREKYHAQPAKKALQTAEDTDLRWNNIEDFLCTREEYVEKAQAKAISTFAVLMDGKWYEKGEMGWWACVSNEKADWSEEFGKLLDGISDETLLTVVDCHI